jgi:hypothetical protein
MPSLNLSFCLDMGMVCDILARVSISAASLGCTHLFRFFTNCYLFWPSAIVTVALIAALQLGRFKCFCRPLNKPYPIIPLLSVCQSNTHRER